MHITEIQYVIKDELQIYISYISNKNVVMIAVGRCALLLGFFLFIYLLIISKDLKRKNICF